MERSLVELIRGGEIRSVYQEQATGGQEDDVDRSY